MPTNSTEIDKILAEHWADRNNDTGSNGRAHRRARSKISRLLKDTQTALLDKVDDEVIGSDIESLGCEVCDNFMTAQHEPFSCQPDAPCANCKHHEEGKCTRKLNFVHDELDGINRHKAEQRTALTKLRSEL